jgi:hypothetical protein
MKNWCWILFVLTIVSSCLDDPDCVRTADTALVISFKRLSDSKADTVILYSISAVGTDSIFYKSTESDELDTLNGFALLSVNPYADETLFKFLFPLGQKIMRVGYKNTARFISEECGSERNQYDLTILETQFDSVRVVNPVLSIDRTPNIEIFN